MLVLKRSYLIYPNNCCCNCDLRKECVGICKDIGTINENFCEVCEYNRDNWCHFLQRYVVKGRYLKPIFGCEEGVKYIWCD